uniref:Uncharacterized protein n=1 Tax=Arundo donax TaxID=35708 RepID=A0A0A8Y0C0_ARUDO
MRGPTESSPTFEPASSASLGPRTRRRST